jgi:hypothetical protein
MRFTSSSILACVIVAVVAATAATAQVGSQPQPADSTGYTLADIAMIGTAPIPLTSLNSFLTNNGVDSTLSNDAFGGKLTNGVALRTDIGKWMASAEFSFSRAPSSVPDPPARLTYWSLQLNGGYSAFELGRFRLTPFLGLGVRFNSLNVSRTEAGQFASFIGDSGANDFEVSNRVLHAELGAGIDYVMPFLQTPFAYTDLLFGVRLGYSQGLSDNGWKHDGRELSGGPGMLQSGLTTWLTIGWQLRQRNPDSQAVATYRAEVGLQEQQRGPKWRFGIIGGPFWSSFSSIDPSNNEVLSTLGEGDMRSTITFGAMASYRIRGPFSLQANLLYSGKGGEIYEDNRTWGQFLLDDSAHSLITRYTADYLELPLLASIAAEFGDVVALRLTCGAYGAVLINSFVERERRYWPAFVNGQLRPEYSTFTHGESDLPPFDAGALLGLAIDINTGGPDFTLEARGGIGFNDIGLADTAIRHRMAAVLLGFWF